MSRHEPDKEEESAVDRPVVMPTSSIWRVMKHTSLDYRLYNEEDMTAQPHDSDELLRRIIRQEFPNVDIPNARQVINIGPAPGPNEPRYKPGTWVEIRGADMKWRLDMITRVVKQAPDDWDWNDPNNAGKFPQWNFFYHAGRERMLRAEELRSPKEGLLRIFGHGPWIWQQWACLKLENKLRFQKDHQEDFMAHDIPKYASDLWDEWLAHASNAPFRAVYEDPRVGELGRSELRRHMTQPFLLMDAITEQNDTTWNFADEDNLSVFTYLSFLGTGYLVPFLVFASQVAIPLVLALASGSDSFFSGLIIPQNGAEPLAAGMSLVIFVLYLYRIVPDTYSSFFNTLGAANTTYSRLMSLRETLWAQRDDTIGQMIGYRMDVYMNTAYIALLYMLNIFIINNTADGDRETTGDALEIILNAVAFEFVMLIDEEVSKSQWWDPESRWISAGAVSAVIQITMELRWLADPCQFARHFGLVEEDLLEACDGDTNLFQNAKVAADDEEDRRYMTKDEIVRSRCKAIAYELGSRAAIEEYEKHPRQFGVDRVLERLFQARPKGVFDRFRAFRTWSRWNKVLFMAPVPNLDDLMEQDEDGNFVLASFLENVVPTPSEPFANYDPKEHDTSYVGLFLQHCWNVLSLRHFFTELSMICTQPKNFKSWLFDMQGSLIRLANILLEWLAFIMLLVFPFYVVAAVIGATRTLLGM